MTVRLYKHIVGNAWGKPQGMTGPEHHWTYLGGEQRGKWKSDCGDHVIDADDEFGGVPSISLAFEHNPLKCDRCERCVALFMATDIGRKIGVQPPYRDALKDGFWNGNVLDLD